MMLDVAECFQRSEPSTPVSSPAGTPEDGGTDEVRGEMDSLSEMDSPTGDHAISERFLRESNRDVNFAKSPFVDQLPTPALPAPYLASLVNQMREIAGLTICRAGHIEQFRKRT
jgi:hypothetical protein